MESIIGGSPIVNLKHFLRFFDHFIRIIFARIVYKKGKFDWKSRKIIQRKN